VEPRRPDDLIRQAVNLLVERCPRLVKACYWAGTSAIALEELGHRQSFDIDLHTCKALQDTRPLLAEIQRAFPGGLALLQAPDEFGGAFSGELDLPGGEKITIEVLSNYEDVDEADLVPSRTNPGLRRISIARYLVDKIQCIAERTEARDLVDIRAVLEARPDLERIARRVFAGQDAIILAERLLGWTDDAIRKDLEAYADVRWTDAIEARRLLLSWLGAKGSGGEGPP